MALSVHSLNQSPFHDTKHHYRRIGVGAETVPLGYYGRPSDVDPSSEGRTSSMTIHADIPGRYDYVFAKTTPIRDQDPMSSQSSHTASVSSRNSDTVPRTACAVPSTSLFGRTSSQRRELTTFAPPKRLPEFCRTAPKRRRSLHDVDGPHTGSLGCKKRRLRRDLITSRLSQPFSSPATHILNREAAAGGKRFLKMAAAAAARRVTAVVIPTPPSTDWDLGAKVAAAQVATVVAANNIRPLAPAEMVRRAAILNRFRLRVCDEARQRGDKTDLEMTASTALLRAGTGMHGVGFLADPKMSQALGPSDAPKDWPSRNVISATSTSSTTISASKAMVPLTVSRPIAPQSLSQTRTGTRLLPPTSPSKPAGPLELDSVFPQQKPVRSPELPAVMNQGMESAGDDDQLSFSATDYSDDFADPDDNDIYTDFSVIFGGGEETAEEPEADDEPEYVEQNSGTGEHFEDYMDDLDGIPWAAR